MIANHIHHALEQVHELQHRILDRQRFRGYSGRARILGGGLALLTTLILAAPTVPRTPAAHLIGWGSLLVIALFINYGTLIYRLKSTSGKPFDIRRFKPVFETLPPLCMGGILSVAMLQQGHYSHLFGIWMGLFGLTHYVSRHVLPTKITFVGAFYMACGAVCLLAPIGPFTNPWPMGLVFFVGEGAGGLLFWRDEQATRARPDSPPFYSTLYGERHGHNTP